MARVKMQLRIGGLGVLSLEDRALMAFVGTQFQIRSAQDNKSKKVVMWWDSTSMSDMQHSAAKEVAQIHLGKVQDNCAYDDAAIAETISRISKMSMRELMEPHNARYYHEYNDNCDSIVTVKLRKLWLQRIKKGRMMYSQ